MMDPAIEIEPKIEAAFQGSTKPSKKRKRVVISCTECHRRKQKCDRLLPCSNCITRNKQSLCTYETDATVVRSTGSAKNSPPTTNNVNNSRSPTVLHVDGPKHHSESAAQVECLGYANLNSHNTLGIFKRIESTAGDEDAPKSIRNGWLTNSTALRDEYKNLIRHLPARSYVDKLVRDFFHDVNWHYNFIDEDIFLDQMNAWNNLSFSDFNKGPQELPGDLAVFPAVLFQALGNALQFQPINYDEDLNNLKYAASMSLDDLANDYSETGTRILMLLGKRKTSFLTVQAGFLRTMFLKHGGMIPESWHALSQTIRDAQEIGLHRHAIVQRSHNSAEALEALWLAELGRRLWQVLFLWDIHMSIVLGRPTTIDISYTEPAAPLDTPKPRNRREIAPMQRTDDDPPTPLTLIVAYHTKGELLRSILILEREGSHPKDQSKIDKLHERILQDIDSLPAFFRSDNPDTRFDSLPDCHWLPSSRSILQTLNYFTLMALHRPYIFTLPKSRTEAIKAALMILRAQRQYFHYLQSKHYKMYNLVLSTFDAIIIIAAIYILYPTENLDYVNDSIQHFEWAMERFKTISQRNDMATAALGVVQTIFVRLKRAIGPGRNQIDAATTAQLSLTPPESSKMANSRPVLNPMIPLTPHYEPSVSTVNSCGTTATSSSVNSDWNPMHTLPQDFDFNAMSPLQPTHDLIFNDLMGINAEGQMQDMGITQQPCFDPLTGQNLQFEGVYPENSFWNYMNQWNPANPSA